MPTSAARHARALVTTVVWFTFAAAAFAAPPPLAPDAVPPGVWFLVGVDDGPNPWPGAAIQLGIADDGTTVFADAGCTRFMATATRDRTGVALEFASRSDFTCDGERAAANAIVLPVLEGSENVEVVAGRLHVRGAGPLLVYAPSDPPSDPGVPGAPPVVSSDRLDTTRFNPIIDASASHGAHWVRDPLQVAMLFASLPSTGRTAIAREDTHDGAASVVRLWFDEFADDTVDGRWLEVRLEQGDDGAWRVVAGRQASTCVSGDGALVAGRCP